jgi:hypothetical protein
MELHLADDPVIGLFPLAPFAQHGQTLSAPRKFVELVNGVVTHTC